MDFFAQNISGQYSTRGYASRTQVPQHVNRQELTSEYLNRIRKFAADWYGGNADNGITDFIKEFLEDFKPSVVKQSGPVLNHADISTTLLVPLMQVTNGLDLTETQSKTLDLFKSFLVETVMPRHLPQSTVKFEMQYNDHEQTVAQHGGLFTVTGGGTSITTSLEVELNEKVAGVNFGDISMIFKNSPDNITEAILNRMKALRTTWDVTNIVDTVGYCARNPGFSELSIMKGDGDVDFLSRVIGGVQTANLLHGSVNRFPDQLRDLIMVGLKAIDTEASSAVILIPESVFKTVSKSGYFREKMIPVHEKAITYNVSPKDVVEDIRVTAGKVTEKKSMVMNLGGFQETPVIVLDNTPLSTQGGKFSIEDEMSTPGMKRVYFTVGSAPQSYHRFCNRGFFAGELDIKPSTLASMNATETSVIDMQMGGRGVKVGMQELHRIFHENGGDPFNLRRYVERLRNIPRVNFGDFNEDQSAQMLTVGWNEKVSNPQCMFEASTRHMLVEVGGALAQRNAIAGNNNGGNLGAVERTVLGNATTMSDLKCEIVSVVSGMLGAFPVTSAITEFLDMIKAGLTDSTPEGLADVLAIRNIGNQAVPNGIIRRLLNKSGASLVLADPFCQVILHRYLSQIIANGPQNGQGFDPTDDQYYPVYKDIIRIIVCGHNDILKLFRNIFSAATFCVAMSGGRSLIDYPLGVGNDILLSILYTVVMPAMTKTLGYNFDVFGGNARDPYQRTSNVGLDMVIPHHRECAFMGDNAELPENQLGSIFIDSPGNNNNLANIFRAPWKMRYTEAMKVLGSGTYPMLLYVSHLMTRFNSNTVINHCDKHYPSGLSYMCVRTVSYVGKHVAIMPQKSVLKIMGNKYAAWPQVGSMHSVYSQVEESAYVPKGLGNTGTVLRNVLLDKIAGYGVQLDPSRPDSIVILDCPNGYAPGCITSLSPIFDMTPLGGRFDGQYECRMSRDEVSGTYSMCPFLNPLLSDSIERIRNMCTANHYPESHSHRLFLGSVESGAVMDNLPQSFRGAADVSKLLTAQGIVNGKVVSDVFSSVLNVMFSDTYGIGKHSDQSLTRPTSELTPVDKDLSPRVCGLPIVSGIPVTPQDIGFATKFLRSSGLTIDNGIYG